MSKIEIEIADIKNESVSTEVWRILQACDHEFLPPLSARDSTTNKNLDPSESSSIDGPRSYFNELLNQSLLIARRGDSIVGFMSFIHELELPELKQMIPTNYVSTICVDADARGNGICSRFYDFMLENLPVNLKSPYVSTRTWSENFAHLKLLDRYGFELMAKIENHRGVGIDTVYFSRKTIH